LSQEAADDQPDAFGKHGGPDSGRGISQPEDEQGERREIQGVAGAADDGRQPEAPVWPTF
jgi:hypothetical protein